MSGQDETRTIMDPKLTVKLRNGPELRRLIEVIEDAATVAEDVGNVKEAKERLRHQLKDLTWLKRLIIIE